MMQRIADGKQVRASGDGMRECQVRRRPPVPPHEARNPMRNQTFNDSPSSSNLPTKSFPFSEKVFIPFIGPGMASGGRQMSGAA